MEKVVDPQGWSIWSQKARKHSSNSGDFQLVQGARHELFHEIAKYKSQAMKLYQAFAKKCKLTAF